MSRRDRERSADALEALAAGFIAWTLYPSARRLVDYFDATDDETIRADASAAADELVAVAERIRTFIGRTTDSDESSRVDELETQLSTVEQQAGEQAHGSLSWRQSSTSETCGFGRTTRRTRLSGII